MRKIKFGTDGWRAVISENFTFENVKIVGQAIADLVKTEKVKAKRKGSEVYGKKPVLIVGYDTRFLSEKYAELVSCVTAANGIRTVLADRPTSTPSVSYNIRYGNYIGGVMITASHNPARYNGIKYKGHFGGSASEKMTDYIESRLYKTGVKYIDRNKAIEKGLLEIKNLVPSHLKGIKKFADMHLLKKAKLNILVDSMNGTGARYLEDLLKDTDNKVTTINSERDPYFGGRSPEPNDVHLKNTAEIVRKGDYDIALATDGDADRLGVISSEGNILSGHKVMTLLLLYLLQDRGLKGGVVQTICGTGLIDKICQKYGLKTYETSVGFKYIAEVINHNDILLGGEETGGVAFKGWLPERDGMLSGLLILEMLAGRRKKLKDILKNIEKTYGTYIYKRYDIRYPGGKKKKLLNTLNRKPFKKILGKKVTNIKSFDGFKFIREDNSWLMLRPSGTEPKLRVYSEAHSQKDAIALIDYGKKFALDM